MNTPSHRLLPLLALCATALAQSPQLPTTSTTTTTTRLASYDRDFGTSQYGGNIAMDASAERRVTSVLGVPFTASLRLDDSVVGRVRIDGRNREAAAVSTFGQLGGGIHSSGVTRSYSAGVSLRVAGQTVLAPTWSGTQTQALELFRTSNTLTFLDTTIPVDVGPVPLNVRVRAEARSSSNAVLSVDPPQLSLAVTGNLRAIATGEASVSTSVLVLEIGVLATLDLLNTRLSPTIGVGYGNGPSGSFSYRVEAARFRIRPYVRVGVPFFGDATHYHTLVDESWGVITGERQLL